MKIGSSRDDDPPAPPNRRHVCDACRAGGGKPGRMGWAHLDDNSAAHYGTHGKWTCLDI